MLQKSQLHFGLHASPFRTDRSIPLLSCEIDRCKDCRAYINMFVAVSEGGRRWRCNMCQAENTLSESNNLMNPSGSYQHCVPQQSIVEFTATKQYLVRETPQPAVHLFLIDVSAHSVSSGMLATTVNVIKDHLFAIPGGCNKRLAFITFNDTIHFYNLKNDSGHPKIQIVPEISDAFVPSYEGFLVSLEESEEVIAELLESLPALYRETNITKSCMGAALKVACELMQLSGGRIMLFLSCLPNAGEPVLLDREAAVEKSTKEGPNYFLPASDFFTVFPSEVCSKFQIGMDLFLFTSQYIDVASLSNLARYSGGTCYYYRGFDVNNFPEMTEKYKNELSNVLCREMALEAVFRMRCSKGLSIENYCGNFFRRSFDLLVIPYANPDFSYSMDVHVDDDLSRLSSVAFQSAFLYTTATGERRIRVCTLCLPVAKTIGDLFRFADSDSMICFLAKIACEKVLEAKISSVREAFFSKVRDILAAYSQGVRGLPKGQYVLPMTLSNFALCTLALMKSVCFDLRTAYKLDDISYYLHLFRIFPVPQLIMSIRPCLFALHYLLEAEHIFQPLPLTFRSIEETGIYLLFNGFEIIVFVLEKVPAILLQQLFGARDFASLSSSYHSKFSCTFPTLENLISQKARALVSYLQGMFPSIFPLFFLVKSTDSNFRSFVSKNFIMDKTETNPSYAEFIDLLYK
ncbi:protein transport protein Sec24B-like [Zophobas morio]|uniref:protein transport protein Sec24B-like n=1 Tax=Zophobas morio TaxID=2755281 RepID=UPI0030835A72